MENPDEYELLRNINGQEDKKNTVLYSSPSSGSSNSSQHVIFFPGDVQDFRTEMQQNPATKQWLEWSFEKTVDILSRKFPTSHIWLVVPAKKIYKIFCIYKNFVKSESLFGIPEHQGDYGGLVHLKKLFFNLLEQKFSQNGSAKEFSLTLIGFSKGCIVLNQILHEVSWISKKNCLQSSIGNTEFVDLKTFIENVKQIYWLDGGHSGQKDIWVRNKEVLSCLKCGLWSKDLKLYIHVTPYQMKDPIHPWKGVEEAEFISGLTDLGVDFVEKFHFYEEFESSNQGNVVDLSNFDKESMLAKHFQVMIEF